MKLRNQVLGLGLLGGVVRALVGGGGWFNASRLSEVSPALFKTQKNKPAVLWALVARSAPLAHPQADSAASTQALARKAPAAAELVVPKSQQAFKDHHVALEARRVEEFSIGIHHLAVCAKAMAGNVLAVAAFKLEA